MPKDKRPPRKLWDRPHQLAQYMETVWDNKKEEKSNYYEYELEDVE